MEQFNITRQGENLYIEGFPDAVKVIKLSGPVARQLADLLLHQTDLHFAEECLRGINQVPDEPAALREALWRSAIVHVMKCFGGSASRSALPEEKILKEHCSEAMLVFKYFKDLRHKYIVHDENSYALALPGAVLNDGTKDYKIEKIVCFGALAHTLQQTNCNNLKLLVEAALEWTKARFDLLSKQITDELEKKSYAELLKTEPLQYRVPGLGDLSKKRDPI